tara:strand:+ start:113 stop:553 length:441 start_codon:yes stop_codon:yes gene_type:complete
MSRNILEKIISISGKPGLFKLLSQNRNVVVAESIMNKERTSTNSIHHISLLSEIQVYGLVQEFPLIEIFEKIFQYESGKKTRIKPKSDVKFLEAYFFEVFKDYDRDRVYPSHIKKIIQWYNILLDVGVLKFEHETLPSNHSKNINK